MTQHDYIAIERRARELRAAVLRDAVTSLVARLRRRAPQPVRA